MAAWLPRDAVVAAWEGLFTQHVKVPAILTTLPPCVAMLLSALETGKTKRDAKKAWMGEEGERERFIICYVGLEEELCILECISQRLAASLQYFKNVQLSPGLYYLQSWEK